ncbi:SEFIR domain-containing protein [Psychrobacillus psychrotolerans]|uniref:SEFIR domain-containing protein n=1 Tax=Psychrobacillus psychrotolerans TaxID=126156 RepID=UPI003314DCA4
MTELKADKVFISYAWSSQEHEEWVNELATRLEEGAGVEVVYDKWDAVEGQNLNAFMQRSVNDPSITKVLVICDETYKQKADEFQGGVGTETVIISNEVYKNVKQTKFVPIIAQRGPNGEEYVPTYLSGTKYIDMSFAQNYEEGFEKLLRNLYGKPEFVRPKRGTPPSFLLRDEKKTSSDSRRALSRFAYDVERKPKNIEIYFNDFVETFKNDMKQYAITPSDYNELAPLMFECLHDTMELRDMFIEFLETYIKEAEVVNTLLIIEFFESIYPLIYTRLGSVTSNYFDAQFDHMKVFVVELMIYTIALLYKFRQYDAIYEIVTNHYFVKEEVDRELDGSIGIFHKYPELIEKTNLPSTGQKYISNTGRLIIDRANYVGISSEDLVQADFLIYLLSFAHGKSEDYFAWYPATSPYFTVPRIQFITRIKSKRFFETVKVMFPVKDAEEMKVLIAEFNKYLTQKLEKGSKIQYNLSLNPGEIAKY